MGGRKKDIKNTDPFAVRGQPTLSELANGMEKRVEAIEVPVPKLALDAYGNVPADKFTITPKGLEIKGDVSNDEWYEFLNGVARVSGALQWVIGDLLAYGDDTGIQYDKEQIAAFFDYEVHTIEQFIYVAREFPHSIRIESLKFGHHQVVASQPRERQIDLLKKAATAGWSVAQLRHALKKATALSSESAAEIEKPLPQKYQVLIEMARVGQSGNQRMRKRVISKISQMEQVVRMVKEILSI